MSETFDVSLAVLNGILDGSGTWQSIESYLEQEDDTKVTRSLPRLFPTSTRRAG